MTKTNRDGSSSSYDPLLDNGYSYNIMDEEVFREELVDPDLLTVTDGVTLDVTIPTEKQFMVPSHLFSHISDI